MTLQKIVELLKTAPVTSIDPPIMEMINAVDIEDESTVRQLMVDVYKAGFYSSVSPFVAALVNPEYTKEYPLKEV